MEGVGIEIADWPIYQKFGNVKMLGVGTYRITIEEKMRNIRQNPSFNEWTGSLSDLELEKLCQKLIQKSQQIEIQCQKFNLPFFDLSFDFENSCDKVADFIHQQLS